MVVHLMIIYIVCSSIRWENTLPFCLLYIKDFFANMDNHKFLIDNHAGLWFTSATDMNVNEHERKSRKLMEIKETVLLFTYNYINNLIFFLLVFN
jgi:hypothetical protein